MPMRYVVLRHDGPRGRHWDFMLEKPNALMTWALAEPPSAAVAIAAERLPDHRMAYLDYEGPISGGLGDVARWDHGTYQIECESTNEIVARVNGQVLQGEAAFRRSPSDPARWTFTYVPRA